MCVGRRVDGTVMRRPVEFVRKMRLRLGKGEECATAGTNTLGETRRSSETGGDMYIAARVPGLRTESSTAPALLRPAPIRSEPHRRVSTAAAASTIPLCPAIFLVLQQCGRVEYLLDDLLERLVDAVLRLRAGFDEQHVVLPCKRAALLLGHGAIGSLVGLDNECKTTTSELRSARIEERINGPRPRVQSRLALLPMSSFTQSSFVE
jgi:hypothetical protein